VLLQRWPRASLEVWKIYTTLAGLAQTAGLAQLRIVATARSALRFSTRST
jgi:hypothetical protein